MATIITKTIGAGGDYANTQAFLSALPASLVALDQQWIGEYIDEVEEVYTAAITSAGCVTDATRNVIVRPQAGLSFADKADAPNQPLMYNAARGKGLRLDQEYLVAFFTMGAAVTFEGVQFRVDNRAGNTSLSYGTAPIFKRCLVYMANSGSTLFKFVGSGLNRSAENSVFIAPGFARVDYNEGELKESFDDHCTFVLNTATDFVHKSDYGHNVRARNNFYAWPSGAWKGANVAVYGVSTNNAGTGSDVGGTSPLLNLIAADQLVAPLTDGRVKSGSALIGAGAPGILSVDIFGRTRSATAPTIGAMEWVVSTPPTGTVTIGTITPSTTSASVPYTYSAWDATGFQYRLNGGTATTLGASPATITGLTVATPYSIEVRATNASGEGAWSTAANFTTSAAGDAEPPTLTGVVTFTSITQTSYTANWPAGSDNVAVTGYEYQIGSTAGAWTDAGNNLSAAITGRTAGATETVYVRNYDAAGLRSTPAISGSVTLESIPAAGINVTEPLKNNTGTVLASQSGVRVAVLQAADLVSVYEATGLTTNASGILATINDAAITTGQQYHVVIKLADGGVGITGAVTAS